MVTLQDFGTYFSLSSNIYVCTHTHTYIYMKYKIYLMYTTMYCV